MLLQNDILYWRKKSVLVKKVERFSAMEEGAFHLNGKLCFLYYGSYTVIFSFAQYIQ